MMFFLDSQVLKYCCHEIALNIGASLTFVGEVREVHVPFVLFFSGDVDHVREAFYWLWKVHVILFLFVLQAVRDKAGNIMIQRPKDLSFLVFVGEDSFNKMVSDRESNAK